MIRIEEVFKLFPRWETKFLIDGKEYGGSQDLIGSSRIPRLNQIYPLAGKRVLELGPLEGADTINLKKFGCREVIAIEGRPQNYVKSCIIKNLFNLDNCHFILGDFGYSGKLKWEALGKFDLCVAIGVLYHVIDPAFLIKRISEIADNLYLWTHYATENYPHGPKMNIYLSDKSYAGKIYEEIDLDSPLSGLQQESLWMFEDSLNRLLIDCGFSQMQVLEKGEMYNWKAKYVLLFASRLPNL